MKMNVMHLTTALVGAIAVSLTGCGQPNQSTDGSTKNQPTAAASTASVDATPVAGGKNYKVLVDPQYPPYDFLDEKGKPVGFDIEILQAIAKQQGFNVTLVSMPWETTLEKLSDGGYDIAVGAIAPSDITDSPNANKLSYSYAYNYGIDAIVSINPVVHHFDQLKNLKVATLADTDYVSDLKELQGNTGNVVESKSFFLALQTLSRKEVDAVLGDKGVLSYHAGQFPESKFVISGKGDYFDHYYPMVIALKNGDPELANVINHGIEAIVKDGTYSKIYEKWFHSQPVIMPKPEPVPTGEADFIPAPTLSTSSSAN